MATIAVLGLGESINLYLNEPPYAFDFTIGVNDIWRYVKTDAIVVLDRERVFTAERLRVIKNSKPQIFYSQIVNWDYRKDFRAITLQPGYPDRACRIDVPAFAKSYCSPFVAVQIAYKLHGATEIHLFGVDLLNHPNLDRKICQKIKLHFMHLRAALNEKQCKIIVHGHGILTA